MTTNIKASIKNYLNSLIDHPEIDPELSLTALIAREEEHPFWRVFATVFIIIWFGGAFGYLAFYTIQHLVHRFGG